MILLSGNVSPARGGVERAMDAIVRELAELGRETAYLEIHPGTAPRGVGVVPCEVAWAHGLLVPLNPGRLRRTVARALRARAGTIEQIWSHNPVVAVVAAEAVPEIPLVYVLPGVMSEILPWDRVHRGRGVAGLLRSAHWRLGGERRDLATEARALREADAVILFSENLRLSVERDYGPQIAASAHVVHPGVELDRFRPRRPEEPDPPELEGLPRPRIAWIGRVEERKGPLLTLEAVESLPGVSVVFGGTGPQQEELLARVAASSASDRARVLGHLAEPERIYRACDVFAMSSLVEPFGHVMLEALASGVPVVGFARDSGAWSATEDVVEDGRTGFLVHETTAPALASGFRRALEALREDPDLRARCRTEAEGYRWSRFVEQVLDAVGGAPPR